MQSASVNLTKLSLELGGKAPQIIFDDANIENALASAVENSFIYTGQSCTLGSRILVQEGIYDNFKQSFIELARQIKVGDPYDLSIDIGPQSNRQQLERSESPVGLLT